MSDTKETTIPEGEKLYLLSALVKQEADLAELVEFVKKHELTLKKSEFIGPKTLSFPVNKQRELSLVSIFFTADSAVVPTFEKTLRHEDYVQRFLLTDWKGDIDAPKRNQDRRYVKAGATEGEHVQS